MLTKITDALGAQQLLVTHGQEAAVDHSGTIAATAVAQQALAPNIYRSGWLLQNMSAHPMYVNQLGAANAGAGSYNVAAGAFFPPPGFPLSTGAISIMGTASDAYTIQEW